jgi:CRP-like cAMP-binding protein
MRAASVPADLLASLDLFAELPPAALSDISARARLRHLAKDVRIFGQDDPAERCHALIDGGIRVAQSDSDGAQAVIRFIGPGELFGTVPLFTDGRTPAEAVTLCDCVEISWSKADLLDLIERHPGIALNLVKIIGGRLKEAQHRIRELSTQQVEQRVANALLRLANQAKRIGPAGTQIDFPLTRKDVAELAGTTLYSVSRILTAWEKLGLVVSRRQRITIVDLGGVARIARETDD